MTFKRRKLFGRAAPRAEHSFQLFCQSALAPEQMRRARSWISVDGSSAPPAVSFQVIKERERFILMILQGEDGDQDQSAAYIHNHRPLTPTPPLREDQYESYGFVQV